MRLEHEFMVDAPLPETWETLLDVGRVASCLPGARIDPGSEGGVYRGTTELKLGPTSVDYRGSARLQDVDEDTHTASIVLQAQEAGGQGTAAALISSRLESINGKTRVLATTDLRVAGRQAQLGRAAIEDAAAAMTKRFAETLEREIRSGSSSAPAAAEKRGAHSGSTGTGTAPRATSSPPSGSEDSGEVLDLGNVLAGSGPLRLAVAAVVAALMLALGLRARRRRGFSVTINLKR